MVYFKVRFYIGEKAIRKGERGVAFKGYNYTSLKRFRLDM